MVEKRRIIMGVDPGSRNTGFGVIVIDGKTPQYISSGVVKAETGDAAPRLRTIFAGLQEIIQTYQPTEFAIEEVFLHKNPGSAIKLGQARGAAIAATFAHELEIFEYSAREIKQSVVGYGNAAKEQVATMVVSLLKLDAVPQADAADALAVALCHFHSKR